MPGPLEGVRVLDLTTMVARSGCDDDARGSGRRRDQDRIACGDLMRHFAFGRSSMSASFLSCNRNKRSIAIDIKTDEGLQIVRKLISTADVLVHNFAPALPIGSDWEKSESGRSDPTSFTSRLAGSEKAAPTPSSAPTIR